MLKILIPLAFSVLNKGLIRVSICWLFIRGLSLFSPDFIQSIFFMEGLSKTIVVLSFWVSGIMLVASTSSFNNKRSLWFVFCVFALNVFLVLTLRSKRVIGLYFLFERTLIPTLFLILGWGNQPERLQASTYLLIYTVFGSLPLLVGIRVLSSSIRLRILSPFIPFKVRSTFWLIVILGLLIKMPIYPVHLWLPKAHVEAPLAGSMALAGVLLKLGAFGVIVVSKFVECRFGLCSLVISLCLWGSVVTSIICLRQTDVKALIAYRSIGHMGLVLAGAISGTEIGVKGALVVVVAHGLSSPAIFRLANIVYETSFSRSVALCKGVISVFPALCLTFFLVCAINMSAPPSINLIGEIWLIISVVGHSHFISGFIGLISLLVGAYTIYLYTSICHGSSPSFFNAGHLYNNCNTLSIIIQIWPLGLITLNLYPFFWL